MKTEHKEKDLFIKLCRYCAYRERAISEVINKMNDLEIKPNVQADLLYLLQEENFLNEARYAKSFVQGKFRYNSWGKNKIFKALLEKKVNFELINTAITSIEDDDYTDKIKELLHKKHKQVKTKNVFETRKKIADYLQRKGYEIGLVWEILKEEIKD